MDLLRTPWFALTWGGPTDVGSSQDFEDEAPASGVVASRSTQKTNATNLYLSGDGYERWGEDRVCEAREAGPDYHLWPGLHAAHAPECRRHRSHTNTD